MLEPYAVPSPEPHRTPLSAVGVLSRRQIDALMALEINSAEALVDRIDDEDGRKAFGPLLDLTPQALDDLCRVARDTTPHFTAARAAPRPPVVAGALKPARPGSRERAALTPTMTPVADLLARGLPPGRAPAEAWQPWLSRMSPVRDQGLRGTCVAHAVCALRSYYEVVSAQAEPLVTDYSEQFLYWWCKGNDGHPDEEGTFVWIAVKGLAAAGVCLEMTWPYWPAPIHGNESQGPPPGEAEPEARSYQLSRVRPISPPTSTEQIVAALDQEKVAAISVQTYPFWTNASTWETGEISLPAGENPSGGHAILIVGYYEPSRQFLFKNSWGNLWAHASVARPGYGLLPFAYVEQDAWEAYTLA